MKLLRIVKSHNPDKRYDAVFEDVSGRQRVVPFGDAHLPNYTMHKDKLRRDRYRSRHQKDLLTNDPTRPGFLSWYILWGDSTSLEDNIAAYKRRFKL